jgi:hypothetical protein
MPKNFNLGFYIKQEHISKAVDLMNLQLSQTNPLYNVSDLSIYKNDITPIEIEKFYKEYVKRDAFYYFQNKFFSLNYYNIQRAYKIREFHFISKDLLVIYYSLGFYIYELLEKYINEVLELSSKKSFKTFYGGRINFDNPGNSNIFYYQDYQEFLKLKEKYTEPIEGKIKYVISLDIKSFFYSIDHQLLLEIIDKKSNPTSKKKNNYDDYSKETIEFFFKFIMANTKGLPVSSQNIFSSFLSSIYLSDFDEFIVDNFLDSDKFKYLRYVDDFYLILEEDSERNTKEIREEIYTIENKIADFLIDKLKLSVSTSKSDRNIIKDINDQIDFLKLTSFESPFEQEFDEEFLNDSILKIDIENKKAPEIFDNCLEILISLKHQTNELSQLVIDNKDSAFLNYLLIHKECLNYSKSKEAIDKIINSQIFNDFECLDFILIKNKVILHLLTIDKGIRLNFFESLKNSFSNNNSITQKVSVLDKFLHQVQFLIGQLKDGKKEELQEEYVYFISESKKLLSNLIQRENKYFSILFKSIDDSLSLQNFTPIYDTTFLLNDNCVALIQQVKQRVVGEKLGFYNVCFNHFLNEFQYFFEIKHMNSTEANSLEIKTKMTELGFKVGEINFVNHFFERRNQNSISHTNKPDIGFWGVSKHEYLHYNENLLPIIEKIFLS